MTQIDGDNIGSFLESAKVGDFQAFARLLSAVDRLDPDPVSKELLFSAPAHAFRIGITGPPGAGKSTLIGQILSGLAAKDLRIGVLAVDPSSPFSKGAILGDRIRFNEMSLKENVFVRSVGSRGSLGGLSAETFLLARAFDLCQFDVLLIETVGVGQTELEIMNVADLVSVVLVPESGDSVQAMKAGLLEIADLFVVNKADRPGAGALARELKAIGEDVEKPVEVVETIATNGDGVDALIRRFENDRQNQGFIENRNSVRRLQAEAKALLRLEQERRIEEKAAHVSSLEDLKNLFS